MAQRYRVSGWPAVAARAVAVTVHDRSYAGRRLAQFEITLTPPVNPPDAAGKPRRGDDLAVEARGTLRFVAHALELARPAS